MKYVSNITTPWMAIALLMMPALALAHTGFYVEGGLAQGLIHPLSGLDHLLAMVAVGLWASQAEGRSLWTLPAIFVGLMLTGAGLAFAGIALPLIEPSILLSVIVLGLLVATGIKIPRVAGTLLVALFGVFHGQAHGLELVSSSSFISYSLGFAVVTMMLHGVGILFGLQIKSEQMVKLTGVAIASAGLAMVFG